MKLNISLHIPLYLTVSQFFPLYLQHSLNPQPLLFPITSGSSGSTNPVGCTWTHSRSMLRAPMASPILMPSPVVWSPLVVGKCKRSGRYLANKESLGKQAADPIRSAGGMEMPRKNGSEHG